MSKLRNPTIEKLASEGKVSTISDSIPHSKYKELYYKQKIFECANYKAGFYSRKMILSQN